MIDTISFVSSMLLAVYLSFVLHEIAHGYVAYKLGDTTAYDLGRLSLNPFKHLSLGISIIIPTVLYFMFGFILLAGKPVPINANNFTNPRKHMLYTALAGPAANLILMLIALFITLFLPELKGIDPSSFKEIPFIHSFIYLMVIYNLIFMLFNLLPIPPLDGSYVIAYILPKAWIKYFMSPATSIMGFVVIILLVSNGFISKLTYTFIKLFE